MRTALRVTQTLSIGSMGVVLVAAPEATTARERTALCEADNPWSGLPEGEHDEIFPLCFNGADAQEAFGENSCAPFNEHDHFLCGAKMEFKCHTEGPVPAWEAQGEVPECIYRADLMDCDNGVFWEVGCDAVH